MESASEAFFASHGDGPLSQRFCIWTAPLHRPPSSLVVHVHAFAEEMNKSRRMVALQARHLAAGDCAVLRWDLLGCGDSAGDFADATWEAWVDDATAAAQLALARFAAHWPTAQAPGLWLWGQRAGALIAAQALGRLGTPWNLLLWNPAINGKAVLQQFLRLSTAASLLGKGGEKSGARAELSAGQCADIAGYTLSPSLAQGLESARLLPPASPARPARLEWIDLGPRVDDAPSPAVQPLLQAWSAAGWSVRHHTVVGPAFWQTTEIEDAPALPPATMAALRADARDVATANRLVVTLGATA